MHEALIHVLSFLDTVIAEQPDDGGFHWLLLHAVEPDRRDRLASIEEDILSAFGECLAAPVDHPADGLLIGAYGLCLGQHELLARRLHDLTGGITVGVPYPLPHPHLIAPNDLAAELARLLEQTVRLDETAQFVEHPRQQLRAETLLAELADNIDKNISDYQLRANSVPFIRNGDGECEVLEHLTLSEFELLRLATITATGTAHEDLFRRYLHAREAARAAALPSRGLTDALTAFDARNTFEFMVSSGALNDHVSLADAPGESADEAFHRVEDEFLEKLRAGELFYAHNVSRNGVLLGRQRITAYLCQAPKREAHDIGLALSLRRIPVRPNSPADLSFCWSARMLIREIVEGRLNAGLIILVGATGSGKSTTLAAILEAINRRRRAHIITLERPIEFLFRNKRSHFTQIEIGRHISSFKAGLRNALRQDPDVLMVGEISGAEEAELAIEAANTGHLVLTSLHSENTAVAGLLKFWEMVGRRADVGNHVRAVIAQKLIPPAEREHRSDRVLIQEILRVDDPAVQNLLFRKAAERAPYLELLDQPADTALAQRHQSFELGLILAREQKLINASIAQTHAVNLEQYKSLMDQMSNEKSPWRAAANRLLAQLAADDERLGRQQG